MATPEIWIDAGGGNRCFSIQIPNEQVPGFRDLAASREISTTTTRHGRESTDLLVCSTDQIVGKRKEVVMIEFERDAIASLSHQSEEEIPQDPAA